MREIDPLIIVVGALAALLTRGWLLAVIAVVYAAWAAWRVLL